MGFLLDLTNGNYAIPDSGRFQLTIQVNLLKIVKKLRLLPSPSRSSEPLQVI
jgi:hypothetical protein